MAAGAVQRNVANSKFYNEPIDEKALFGDPEARLTAAFFDISDLYRDQCMDEQKLESMLTVGCLLKSTCMMVACLVLDYLTHAMETLLYFTIPHDDFKCLPLRNFLSTMLANVVCKPILELLSDPDFINLMVARLVSEFNSFTNLLGFVMQFCFASFYRVVGLLYICIYTLAM